MARLKGQEGASKGSQKALEEAAKAKAQQSAAAPAPLRKEAQLRRKCDA